MPAVRPSFLRRAAPHLTRFGAAIAEQGFWSVLNFGLNLAMARWLPAEQYGAFAFWSNLGFVLVSLQNALTVTHLIVLPPGDQRDPRRMPTERLMHTVELIFLAVVAVAAAAGGVYRSPYTAPAAALFLPAFLAQQYVRSLTFSRNLPVLAAAQSAAVLAIVAAGLIFDVLSHRGFTLNGALALLAFGYGWVALAAGSGLCWRQFGQGKVDLRDYRRFVREAGWIFLGVSTTELLGRFYAFVVAAWFGPTALAILSAAQILMRPIPLLASSWGMVARPDLVRRREGSQWRVFTLEIVLAMAAGVVIGGVWTFGVTAGWPWLSHALFAGKYGGVGWMALLWGVSGVLSFGQTVLSVGLQVLKAFKALALANTAASLLAAAAIIAAMAMLGYSGAIIGTALGQLLEVVIMTVLLRAMIRIRLRDGGPPAPARVDVNADD